VIDGGIRTTHGEFGGRASSGYDFIDNDTDASDCGGHGTHVAGIIGGARYGVAKGVSLVAVRVLGCTGLGTTSGFVAGVNWVTANAVKPAVANMSLWSTASTALDDAVRSSIASGIVYTVIAGNGTSNDLVPTDACGLALAGVTQAIVVGATTPDDQEVYYSNYGSCVDLLAPGWTIPSSWYASDADSAVRSGTSMAAPHVAGAVAQYLQQHPSATPAAVSSALTANASTSKVMLGAASAAAGTPNRLLYTPVPAPAASISGAFQMAHGATCTWNATVTGGAPPYTYNWSFSPSTYNTYLSLWNAYTATVSGTGAYYGGLYTSGTGNLYLTATDAVGTVAVATRTITIRQAFSGCY
jgi:subtilisin family serine protease